MVMPTVVRKQVEADSQSETITKFHRLSCEGWLCRGWHAMSSAWRTQHGMRSRPQHRSRCMAWLVERYI